MFDTNQRLAQLLRNPAVRRKVDLVILQNSFVRKSLKQVVDVIAAKMRVAIGGKNLVDVTLGCGNQFQYGNVKGAAAQIVYRDYATLFLGQGGGSSRGWGRCI